MIGTGAFNGQAQSYEVHINMELANIQNFNQTIGDQAFELKVLLSGGEPWFRGTDVAGALGYKDVKKAIRMHVDEEDKQKLKNLRGDEMSPLEFSSFCLSSSSTCVRMAFLTSL